MTWGRHWTLWTVSTLKNKQTTPKVIFVTANTPRIYNNRKGLMPLPCNEPRWGSPCITSYSKGYAFPSTCCEVYRSRSHQENTVIINYLALNWHKIISFLRWAPCGRFSDAMIILLWLKTTAVCLCVYRQKAKQCAVLCVSDCGVLPGDEEVICPLGYGKSDALKISI